MAIFVPFAYAALAMVVASIPGAILGAGLSFALENTWGVNWGNVGFLGLVGVSAMAGLVFGVRSAWFGK